MEGIWKPIGGRSAPWTVAAVKTPTASQQISLRTGAAVAGQRRGGVIRSGAEEGRAAGDRADSEAFGKIIGNWGTM